MTRGDITLFEEKKKTPTGLCGLLDSSGGISHIAIQSDFIGRAVHPSTLGLKITNKYVIINMQKYKFKSGLLLRDHEEKFLASLSHLL